MQTNLHLTTIVLFLSLSNLSATTHFVALDGSNPTPPYTNWLTAAANIQDAVAAAASNDVVLVNDGVYPGTVTVNSSLELLSVNGPQFTAINGGGVSLPDGASLTGFTVTNGSSGVLCASLNVYLTNCVITGNSGGGGVNGGTLYNCTLSGNSATYGGGASSSLLFDCTLISNSAAGFYPSGGGAFNSTLYRCSLVGNSAVYSGGGVSDSTLYECGLTNNSATEWNGSGGGADGSMLYHCSLAGNSAAYRGGGAAGFSALCDCTLSSNSAGAGGGAYSCLLTNCVLTGNSAQYGGGVEESALVNCILAGNSATVGGGEYQGQLYNCTLTGNSADQGGGVSSGSLYNCIIYFNTATSEGDNYDEAIGCMLTCCCTTPHPYNGLGDITNAPLFVDDTDGDFHLQPNSPCINAATNLYVASATDLDGDPRIVGGTVDMGAYEYQGSGPVPFHAWLQYYGLPSDGSADLVDSDGDGMNNWQEWVCGTCPTNAQSVLRMVLASPTAANATVIWQSAPGVNYFLERSASLSSPFTLVATNLVGQPGSTSYADTNAAGSGPLFYRVGVRVPW